MKTILLVDDDLQLRSMFSMALSRNGYRVIEAASGDTGLLMARQHLPDLILTDIHMPGGDGATLLHDIRLDPELRSKQVVLMTGRPDLVTPRRGMEEGADDFLVKPVSLDALLNCLEARFNRASISWRVEDERLAQLRATVPPQLPHEFFTPLAGIIGLVDLLRSDASLYTPDEISDIYSDIHQSALRLHRTIRNYLLILDLQTAKEETLASPVSPLSSREVEKYIQAGADEALGLNNQRRSDLSLQLNPCSIAIKPADLSRVVEELVDNAFKFSRQGTPVGVELNAEGLLIITDQGRGMSTEEIRHIGAFQQFDRKKNEQQGLGLGLVLVQKITALYQASFLLEAEPGKGTRVQIGFPVATGT